MCIFQLVVMFNSDPLHIEVMYLLLRLYYNQHRVTTASAIG